MSVNPISLQEFASFVAICTRQNFAPFADALDIATALSAGNGAAYQRQYDEAIETYTRDEIEAESLKLLADRATPINFYGGLTYNCVTNGGTLCYGDEIHPPTDFTDDERAALRAFGDDEPSIDIETSEGLKSLYHVYCRAFGYISNPLQMEREKIVSIASAVAKYLQSPTREARKLEKLCSNWSENERRRRERQAEDDQAYIEVPPCEMLTRDEVATRCRAARCERVIIATFRVDESDLQTDYFGHRTARTVVIGFGKGKRESFKQLREAAHLFPSTAHLGPGKGRFSASVCWDHDSSDEAAKAASRYRTHDSYRKGDWVRSADKVPTFETLEELQAYIEAHPLGNGRYYSPTELKDGLEAIEHRENYSMGGGNYLGSRHSGWMVSSETLDYFKGSNKIEFYEPTTEDLARPVSTSKITKPAKPYPVWNAKGYLSEGGYCARHFRKTETADKEVAKLTRLGFTVEKAQNRRGEYFIKLVEAPAQPVEPVEAVEPVDASSVEPVTLYDWLGCPIN